VILPELVQADVVYLGFGNPEDQNPAGNYSETQTAQSQNCHAMEMFQRPQSVLDRYLAGQVSEQSYWSKASTTKGGAFPGNTMPRCCDSLGKQLPVIALNTPTEVTQGCP